MLVCIWITLIYLNYVLDNKITLEKQYFGKVYQQQQSVNSQIKRHLAGVVDPTKCTATGTGIIF